MRMGFWRWNDSTTRNPEHKYRKAGEYTVSLTVKNAKDTGSKTRHNYVTVEK